MKKGIIVFWLVLIAIIVAGVGASLVVSSRPGQLDSFAQCLTDKGAVFYGAFWCPHCQATKRLFGASAKLLPYVECSTSDGREQLSVCKDKGVTNYPTWVFADGNVLTGELTLQQLSEASGCQLSQQ